MSKPLGISLLVDAETGLPRMGVVRSDDATDKAWDAVEAALDAGWTVDRFRAECREAWAHRMKQ